MRLNNIFSEQKDFLNKLIAIDTLSKDDKVKYTKEYILSIHRELSEVLDTFHWKLHRKEVITETNTTEEIIDCFKYLLNLCVLWDIDADTFFDAFIRKSKIVRQRYGNEINQTNQSEKTTDTSNIKIE